MPLQATSGAASYDAFGGGVPVSINYIEEVFQTWLYTGNGSTQTITNGIDLAGKGGMVFFKGRSATTLPLVQDTVRGATSVLFTHLTNAAATATDRITSFNSDGVSIGSSSNLNSNGTTYASWTFRKQPKFFDVVTYTGNGTAGRTVAHNLGSVPGCIIVKSTSSTEPWAVYHRSLGATKYLRLNETQEAVTPSAGNQRWNSTEPTSTVFTVGSHGETNQTDATYVAYVFAHDAGGFGLTGTDNVISCGSYGDNTTDVNLGYEPQWIMIKNTTSSIAYAGWAVFDNMRGLSMISRSNPALLANSSTAEYGTYNGAEDYLTPTATGFKLGGGTTLVGGAGSSGTWIYIAIRRGPMKVPTSGTSVYNSIARTGTGATATVTGVGFAPDLAIAQQRTGGGTRPAGWFDRLRGATKFMGSDRTAAEYTDANELTSFNMNGITVGISDSYGWTNAADTTRTYINHLLKRAPSFFDVVCGTSDASGNTFTSSHNLTVAPELVFIKSRNAIDNWWAIQVPAAKFGTLNGTGMDNTLTSGDYTGSASTFSFIGYVGNSTTHVAYLFATCAGVSKVGSYTGNGSSQTINCGFTGGARFVLIKKSSGTGDWMVSDSARGIVSGNDPYLELNNTNAEVTGEDWLDTDSTGFVVNEVSGSNANTNGATYIFLAIA